MSLLKNGEQMFRQPGNSRAISASIRELDRRLRSMEQGLGRVGTRTVSRANGTADHVTDAISSVLASLADRYRSLSIADEAARFGKDAAKFGNDALHRLSKEVEHRPLVTLAVAAGVGLLLGLIVHRRS
jgi:ElaB/YqjD/DUF883 family membrane-anchored ribosome-binding protein